MIRILLILHLTFDMLGPFQKNKRGESTDWDLERVKLLVLTENKKGVGVNSMHGMTSMPIPEISVEVSRQGRKLRQRTVFRLNLSPEAIPSAPTRTETRWKMNLPNWPGVRTYVYRTYPR